MCVCVCALRVCVCACVRVSACAVRVCARARVRVCVALGESRLGCLKSRRWLPLDTSASPVFSRGCLASGCLAAMAMPAKTSIATVPRCCANTSVCDNAWCVAHGPTETRELICQGAGKETDSQYSSFLNLGENGGLCHNLDPFGTTSCFQVSLSRCLIPCYIYKRASKVPGKVRFKMSHTNYGTMSWWTLKHALDSLLRSQCRRDR